MSSGFKDGDIVVQHQKLNGLLYEHRFLENPSRK